MYQLINTAQLAEFISKENPYIFDTRDISSYQTAHIKGAKHLSRDNIVDVCTSLDKNRAILVYCYRGVSSQNIAQYLVQKGFNQVYSLEGGFDAWQKLNPMD